MIILVLQRVCALLFAIYSQIIIHLYITVVNSKFANFSQFYSDNKRSRSSSGILIYYYLRELSRKYAIDQVTRRHSENVQDDIIDVEPSELQKILSQFYREIDEQSCYDEYAEFAEGAPLMGKEKSDRDEHEDVSDKVHEQSPFYRIIGEKYRLYISPYRVKWGQNHSRAVFSEKSLKEEQPEHRREVNRVSNDKKGFQPFVHVSYLSVVDAITAEKVIFSPQRIE